MRSEPLIVRTKQDLFPLVNTRTARLIPRGRRRIMLQIEGLDPKKTERSERAINRFYHSCGCGEGALFLFFGLALFLGYLLLFSRQHTVLFSTLLGFLFPFSFAIAGKFIGILYAKVRLRRVIKKLVCMTEGVA
jgi:hypothetical protein